MNQSNTAWTRFPVLVFDLMEPFLPSRVGYSLFHEPCDSRADYRRRLAGDHALSFTLPGLSTVIEYGVWWDWDIEHLYELEAVWVYLDESERLLRVEASWHGRFNVMEIEGKIPLRDGRPLLYSQPGKHAFAPSPDWFKKADTTESCRTNAGKAGVHVTPLFEGRITKDEPRDALARGYLRKKAFVPSFRFVKEWRMPPEAFVPWVEMEAWIPRRVEEILTRLREGMTP